MTTLTEMADIAREVEKVRDMVRQAEGIPDDMHARPLELGTLRAWRVIRQSQGKKIPADGRQAG